MYVQIENTKDGYIVSAFFQTRGDSYPRWHRLRNFGDRQGDAINYRDSDVWRLNEASLNILAKNFDVTIKYKRLQNFRQGLPAFVRQKPDGV